MNVTHTEETTEDAAEVAKIKREIDALRDDLIDIGAWNNSLVNFKPSKHPGADLYTVDTDALYKALVEDGKRRPIRGRSKDQALMPAQGNDEHDFGDLKDNFLYADLTPDQLRTRLTTINRETKRHRQEMGFEYLYLALGFLTYDVKDGKAPKTAPLVLIPIDLVLSPARTLFSATYNGVEISPNFALEQRLKHDFNLELPRRPEDTEPSQWFNDVERAIETQEGWKVDRSRVHLGFFSNASFLMYQDLDPENWTDPPLHEHPLLCQLLGSGSAHVSDATTLNDGGGPPGGNPVQLTPVVLDADSSQMDAIIAADSGRSMVIQGPPGTGKSQTITNIIARKITQGEKVLFVSAKLAALEVVKRRLDDVQLGDAALELHSHKANRRTVLGELKRTLDLGEPTFHTHAWQRQELFDSEKFLSDHFKDVHKEINQSKRSYVQVSSELEELNPTTETADLNFVINGLAGLSEDELQRGLTSLRDLAEQREVIGDPNAGPLRNLNLSSLEQHQYAAAMSGYEEALVTLETIVADGRRVARAICVSKPEDFVQLQSLIRFASTALAGPPPDDIASNAMSDTCNSNVLRRLVGIVDSLHNVRERRKSQVAEAAWDQHIDRHRSVWNAKGRSWFRWLSKEYRFTRSHLRDTFGHDVVSDFDTCVETMDDVIEYQRLHSKFREIASGTESALGPLWRGADSRWSDLDDAVEWVQSESSSLDSKVRQFKAQLRAANSIFGTDLYRDRGGSLANDGFAHATAVLQHLTALDFVALLRRVKYNELRDTAQDGKLGACVDLIHSGICDFDLLKAVVMRRWLESLRDHARSEFSAITNFTLNRFGRIRSVFVKRDEESLTWARADAMQAHSTLMPELDLLGEQMGAIKLAIAKPKSRGTIRTLIEDTQDAIMRIKPIFMMSPMSVAKFIPRGHSQFDVVIFDEASQLRASEATGAIARAKQVIVVGDNKQLPPSNFFKLGAEDEPDEHEDEADVVGIKSILDLFVGKAYESTTLRWHYRSRSEDLIDFSNGRFYDHNLITFPSSGNETLATGLSFNFNPENFYTPKARINRGEARAVAQRVMLHARESADLSLGVVAFSVRQRDLILDELESIRMEHRELDDFFSEDRSEPFFVKNLENVQGDERDVIFISIGYGRQKDGSLALHFGPINKEGGERRLNVLVTRAKLAMEVFCNFKADELKVPPKASPGLVAFRDFMAFAENPRRVLPKETGLGAESLFEEQVADVVKSLGYDIQTQVGMSGYRIDIGVRSTTKPGSYALGIECDGASYHSSFSARDRDRLRQNHLESMGWRIHRIWSTDWFQSGPEDRKRRLREAIEAAQAASDEDT